MKSIIPRTAVCFKRPQRDFFNGFGTAGQAGGGRGVDKINDALLARFFSVCGATMWPGPGDHNPLPPKWEEAEEHVRGGGSLSPPQPPSALFIETNPNYPGSLPNGISSFIHPYSTPSSDYVCDELKMMEEYTVRSRKIKIKQKACFLKRNTDIWLIVVLSYICLVLTFN